jgi:hypothetical protein
MVKISSKSQLYTSILFSMVKPSSLQKFLKYLVWEGRP